MLDIYLTDTQLEDPDIASLTLKFRERGGGATACDDGRTRYSTDPKFSHKIFPYIPFLLSRDAWIEGTLDGVVYWVELPKGGEDREVPDTWINSMITDIDGNTTIKTIKEYTIIRESDLVPESVFVLVGHSLTQGGQRISTTFDILKKYVDEYCVGDYTKVLTMDDYISRTAEIV